MTPEQREYVIEALVTVEQVPRDAIDEAVPFDWTDQASYVESLDQVETALNRAFLVGHLPVRAAVMGPEARALTRRPRPTRSRRCTSSWPKGCGSARSGSRPIRSSATSGPTTPRSRARSATTPSCWRSPHALGAGPGPGLFTMAPRALLLDREQRLEDLVWHEQLAADERQAGGDRSRVRHVRRSRRGRDLLDAMAAAQARGNRVVGQVSPRPFELWTRLDAPGVLVRVLPTLHAAVKDGGADGVRRLAHDEAGMDKLRDEGANIRPSLIFSGRWDHVHVRYTTRSGDLRDRDLDTISMARGEDPTDLLIDIALNDDFETQFADRDAQPRRRPARRARRAPGRAARRQRRGRAHAEQHRQLLRGVDVAALGAGARGATLETAVAMLTAQQADLFGIRDRGRITPGAYADLVLFDPAHIGIDDVRYVQDMPAGGTRLVAEPVGITASVVNGTTIIARRRAHRRAARERSSAATERHEQVERAQQPSGQHDDKLTARHNVIGSKRMRRAMTSAAMSGGSGSCPAPAVPSARPLRRRCNPPERSPCPPPG